MGWVTEDSRGFVGYYGYGECHRVNGSCEDISGTGTVDQTPGIDSNQDLTLMYSILGDYGVISGGSLEFQGKTSFPIRAGAVVNEGLCVVADYSKNVQFIYSDETIEEIQPILPDAAIDMKAFSASEIYVATSGDILRLRGGAWKSLGDLPYTPFKPSQLEGSSGDDLWMIGQDGASRNRLIHWNGNRWSKVEAGADPRSMSVAGGVIGLIFEQFNGTAARVFHRIAR